MNGTVESEARRKVSWDMANNGAVELGVQKLFLESRQWPGYRKAFNSWERAVWKWADSGVASKTKSRWRQYLLENRYLRARHPREIRPDGMLADVRSLSPGPCA
jgi:hypothetical protein